MTDPFAEYFGKYPSFNYIPEPDWRQKVPFNALAEELDWSQEFRTREYEKFKDIWRQAVDGEFAETDLERYQNLCGQLGVLPIPESIKECKRRLYFVHVNIVDLMQYRRDVTLGLKPEPLKVFRTVEELKEYTKREKKFCPVDTAKAKLLRPLLKPMSESSD